MYDLHRTDEFVGWLRNLRDRTARGRILERLTRVEGGNFGDVKSVGDGVFEMRIGYGPGYRVYYVLDGRDVVVLLCGGDKSSQSRDIKRAKEMARAWRR